MKLKLEPESVVVNVQRFNAKCLAGVRVTVALHADSVVCIDNQCRENDRLTDTDIGLLTKALVIKVIESYNHETN